ncbi:MAG: hypothetical protein KAR31_00520, partial [Candidatus Omnitrophica bacterium]|nr:hypothetical protein [Candidatus Omnitrophota bacterium]
HWSTDGSSWTKINTDPIADNGGGSTTEGPLSWIVPNQISTTMRVRVQNADSGDSETYKVSPLFDVVGAFKLTSPSSVGGEKWGVGGGLADQTISWQWNGTMAPIYLWYSKTNSPPQWVGIESSSGVYTHGNSGSIPWDVADAMSTTARIRIADDPITPTAEYIAPADFKIMARFDVTYPDGGETILAGLEDTQENRTITWDYWGADADNVKIEIATDGDQASPTYTDIVASTLNNGSFEWTPVDVTKVTPTAKIRISDATNADMDTANESASPFFIRASYTIDPAIGTADLEVGEVFEIKWTKKGDIPEVVLE